jgi:hypothetical protein
MYSGDVLRRSPFEPLVQIAAVVNPFDLGQLVLGMAVKVGAVPPQGVGEQHFGGESWSGDARFVE